MLHEMVKRAEWEWRNIRQDRETGWGKCHGKVAGLGGRDGGLVNA